MKQDGDMGSKGFCFNYDFYESEIINFSEQFNDTHGQYSQFVAYFWRNTLKKKKNSEQKRFNSKEI